MSFRPRPSPKRSVIVAIAIVSLGFMASIPTPSAAAETKPNVLILLADDLGWADVGYHGGEIETPSIDRIAREGVQLDRFYVAPICSPTRAALVTGRDPLKLGIAYDQIHPWYNVGLAPNEITIADVFRAAGYQTGLVGKWHLGHTLAHHVPNAQGFEQFWGHLHTNTDFYTHEREGALDLQQNGQSVVETGKYLTHLEAREAERYIRERDKDKPFFLYVPFTAPHTPMQAPPETIEKYSALPNTRSRRTYAAMVDEVDQAVGSILAALEDEGILDDTIVLFFSDNGGSNAFGGVNTPLRGEKGQTFEGGIRVPAIIRYPKDLEAGGVMRQMTTVMDLLPTLVSAVGAEIETTEQLDGQDMWPALAEGKTVPRQKPVGFVSEIPLPGVIHTAIFDGPWKLVQVLREKQTETQVQSFLFRVAEDPNEEQDLSADHPEVVEQMSALMHDWRRQHPMAGTRSTLVAHPGWVAPKRWAEAVTPAELLQEDWKNELPFSKAILDATADRGVLVDEATRERLIEEEKRRLEQRKSH